ncbi:hypothetical protein CL658_03080 [bacterium]|nr:hypothetical protein [bacterium]|tara:strand:+ start:899 stop:1339 length:441 start_codon:yes stop_codon:yes gene_type:complete
MNLAEKNDIVTIHYSIHYSNGKLVDTTHKKRPVRFILGSSKVLPYVNKLIIGMTIGEIKTTTVKAKDAFGEKSKDLIKSLNNETVPKHIKKEIGNKIEIHQHNETPLIATIIDVQESFITIDANPEPIGKDLVIKIELLDIETENS